MRIISGSCRGRKLVQIEGLNIRPTSDRIREAIFNIIGPSIRGKRVLDLFAGTGALGIEALSRGASHATFIDQSCDIVYKNLKLCRLQENAHMISCDITKYHVTPGPDNQKFDLVFIDPPYQKGLLETTFAQSWFIDLLSKDCTIIAEHSWKEDLNFLSSILDIYRQKKYSKTIISFIRKL